MTIAITFFAAVLVLSLIVTGGIVFAPMVSVYIGAGLVGVAVLALVIFGDPK